MPNQVNRARWALLLALGLGSGGCSAVCVRDSDCLGESVCSENRCILIVGRDAGRASSSSPDDSSDDVSSEPDAATTARDAGN